MKYGLFVPSSAPVTISSWSGNKGGKFETRDIEGKLCLVYKTVSDSNTDFNFPAVLDELNKGNTKYVYFENDAKGSLYQLGPFDIEQLKKLNEINGGGRNVFQVKNGKPVLPNNVKEELEDADWVEVKK